MQRRTFLGTGLATAACGATIACRGRREGPYWRFFTAEEARTVDAVCARIIPADRDPGAKEARVVNYIDMQLTKHFRKYQRAYRRGIAAIDRISYKQSGKAFVELSEAGQTDVLKDLEEHSRAFFDLLLAHTRQGFYGDPRHGGNYRMASWTMVGLAFPPVRGRQHYEEPKAG